MKILHCVGVVAGALALAQGGAAMYASWTEQPAVIGAILPVNTEIQTSIDLVFRVSRYPDKGYWVLVGPHPTGSSVAKFTIKTRNSGNAALISIADGYGYVAGDVPYGGTDGGTATSDGSIFAIEATQGGVDNYFFLDSNSYPPGRMTVTDGTGVSQQAVMNERIEIDANGHVQAASTIPANGTQRNFVDYVVGKAREAGLLIPD